MNYGERERYQRLAHVTPAPVAASSAAPIFTMAVSLVAATTFQLAHSVEGADIATPDEVAIASRPWAMHQVETTVDFCPRNPVLTWLLAA